MKIVVSLDSFKGTISAANACDAVCAGLKEANRWVDVSSLPMADGGEGTADAVRIPLGGKSVPLRVQGPFPGEEIDASLIWLPKRKSALVEMASASGLVLVPDCRRDPMVTSTYGTGQLLVAAMDHGAREIVLTIGGSATTDGGIGAASALGWRFLDVHGKRIVHGGRDLASIVSLDGSEARCPKNLRVMCDVTNPLTGPKGAAVVYGPQKGADKECVASLDAGLSHLANCIRNQLGIDVDRVPGAGAAGGLGAGSLAFMGGTLVRGIDAILDLTDADQLFCQADWVVTGEGCFDQQSLQGKVVQGVTSRARVHGARVAVIAGDVRIDEVVWRDAGIETVISLSALSGAVMHAMEEPEFWLKKAGRDLLSVIMS